MIRLATPPPSSARPGPWAEAGVCLGALGGEPLSISMMDLPSYLENGGLDGILSTYETVDSAKLDSCGIGSVLEDEEYYPFYVPLAGAKFWSSLSPGLRERIADSWKKIIVGAREESARAQAAAKNRLKDRGLVVFQPSQAERNSARKTLAAAEDSMPPRSMV